MLYQIKQYIKFLKTATNQHGVHSPFVYELVTRCFYNKTYRKAYDILKTFRKELYTNTETITITDFGSGSRVFKSNQRKISQIAKTSGITSKRAKLLYRIAQYLGAKKILELGTSLGLGTSALSLADKNANITTIEGCPEIGKIAQQQFHKFQLNNIDLKTDTFKNTLPQLVSNTYDLIYIDGHHDKEATINYFETLLPTTNNNTVFIFDDIHWSKGMTEAWEIIKAHPKVTISIDTFFWGIICFRKEQAKEHFTIRV
ncbi:MAG: methyltransferase [Bacteroidetes bacterium]|nr:MAG: methyltransferase [Bacteroidota bacterium]